MSASVETVKSSRAADGKYLTFILAQEAYGLEILKVREIIGLMAITKVLGNEELKEISNASDEVIEPQ